MKVGGACEESEIVFKIHLVTVTVSTFPSDSGQTRSASPTQVR